MRAANAAHDKKNLLRNPAEQQELRTRPPGKKGPDGVQSTRSLQHELTLTFANVLKVPLTQAFSTK